MDLGTYGTVMLCAQTCADTAPCAREVTASGEAVERGGGRLVKGGGACRVTIVTKWLQKVEHQGGSEGEYQWEREGKSRGMKVR